MSCPSELTASSQISLLSEIVLWGGSSTPNELFPSSFSLSCRLVSTHIWHLCNRLSELLSCWTGRPRRQMNGCYSDVRRAFKRLSLRGAFVDDWLWSLMAWHNHLPPYLTSSPELSFHPPLYSVYLCLDLVSACVCIYATVNWTGCCDDDFNGKANDDWLVEF